ncbi:hypothetical protein [Kiloniella antarctica]|uniref:DUF3592 domain-containing protein n=1 Tax=Kiloniella antarctica TaxID=1550907 RepID=A0ABW5BKI8_9PROT
MFRLGFLTFIVTYILFFNELSQSLFQINLWKLVVAWWRYDTLRYLCLFMNFVFFIAALLFAQVINNLAALLLGKKETFIYLGKALGKGLYVSRESDPREEVYLPGDFTIFGSAGFDSLYRRILMVSWKGMIYAPQDLHPFKAFFLLSGCLITLLFSTVTNLFVFKIYAFENFLFPDYITSNNTNIEGLATLLAEQDEIVIAPWLLSALVLFGVIILIQRIAQPARMSDKTRMISVPAKIRPGYEMQGQILDQQIHYGQKGRVINYIIYLIKLEKPFKPSVYMTWFCDDPNSDIRKIVDKAWGVKRPVTIMVRDFQPAVKPSGAYETPYTFEIIG